MAEDGAPEVAAAKAEAEKRAKILEGVDFIETEEDAEAVESAVVKIQSTFRGKKIRSKLNQKQANNDADSSTKQEQANNNSDNKTQQTINSSSKESKGDSGSKTTKESQQAPGKGSSKADEENLLNKKVASMQVNDNNKQTAAAAAAAEKQSGAQNQPEDEAERAATKIQAGFKGYKTRKELEGKLSGQSSAPASNSSG